MDDMELTRDLTKLPIDDQYLKFVITHSFVGAYFLTIVDANNGCVFTQIMYQQS